VTLGRVAAREGIVKFPRRQFLHFAAGAAALPALTRTVRAQAYPTRPITIIIPFPPGGANDMLGRILAERMRGLLSQSIVIENVGGASGSIGVGRAVRSPADGYTLNIGSVSSHVLSGAIYALPYDLVNDLEPVALLAFEPLMIVGRKGIPAADLKELIAWLKANPGKASQGNPGTGSLGQIIGALFQKETGTKFQAVPYRGGGPAIQDLVAGHIDLMIEPTSNFAQHIPSGAVKPYAVAAKTRVPAALHVPTVDEAGLPGFYASLWLGLWLPKSTPKDVVAKLNSAVIEALADPAVRQRLTDIGQNVPPPEQQTPEALGAFQKAEIEKWWPIIKAANIKAE
jgi:tripartite-type tricarboxylate transporter receptor subunit TctC